MVGLSSNQLKLLVCALGFGLSATACGGDDGGGTTPPPSTVVTKGPGDGQSGVVGQVLPTPLQVTVNRDGTPLAGTTVNWSTTAPNGSLAATTSTDASGVATNDWQLGTVAGQQSAQAAVSGASGSPVTFTATASPDAAAALSDLSGNGQSGEINAPLGAPVQAKVSDQFGNGVPGVAVNWAATNATVSAASVPSDAAGTSSVNVTLGSTEGPVTITAISDGLDGSPVTFTATASAVEPGPSTATVNVLNDRFQPAALTVAAGTTVVWRWGTGSLNHNVAPSGGTQPPRSGNPVSAPATYQFRFDTPGSYNYICEVHASVGMTGTITVQ